MRTMNRFAALMAAGSLIAASTPVFALNVGVNADTSVSNETEVNGDNNGVNASASTNAKVNASVMNRCRNFTGDEAEQCKSIVKAQIESRGNADLQLNHGGFVKSVKKELNDARAFTREKFEKARMRVEKVFERSINALGKMAQKICKNENSEDSAIRSCLSTIKASVSAKISAMIDAAFTL